jgi:hypothetical protein
LGNELGHLPREGENGRPGFLILGLCHKNLQVARVGIEEAIDIRGERNGIGLLVHVDLHDRLLSPLIREMGDGGVVVSQHLLLPEDEQGA